MKNKFARIHTLLFVFIILYPRTVYGMEPLNNDSFFPPEHYYLLNPLDTNQKKTITNKESLPPPDSNSKNLKYHYNKNLFKNRYLLDDAYNKMTKLLSFTASIYVHRLDKSEYFILKEGQNGKEVPCVFIDQDDICVKNFFFVRKKKVDNQEENFLEPNVIQNLRDRLYNYITNPEKIKTSFSDLEEKQIISFNKERKKYYQTYYVRPFEDYKNIEKVRGSKFFNPLMGLIQKSLNMGKIYSFEQVMERVLYTPFMGFYVVIETPNSVFTTHPKSDLSYVPTLLLKSLENFANSGKKRFLFCEYAPGGGEFFIQFINYIVSLCSSPSDRETMANIFPTYQSLIIKSFNPEFLKNFRYYMIDNSNNAAGQKIKLAYMRFKKKNSRFLKEIPEEMVQFLSKPDQIKGEKDDFLQIFANELPDAFPAKAYHKIGEQYYETVLSEWPVINRSFNEKPFYILKNYFFSEYQEIKDEKQNLLFAQIDDKIHIGDQLKKNETQYFLLTQENDKLKADPKIIKFNSLKNNTNTFVDHTNHVAFLKYLTDTLKKMDCSWEILLSDYCGNEPDIRTFKTVKDRGFFCPSYLYPYDITYNVRFNFIEEHFKKHTKGLTIKR